MLSEQGRDAFLATLADYNRRIKHLETLESPLGTNPSCRAYNKGNLVTGTGAWTWLTFDNERFDTDNIHSVMVNTGRLTCNTAGKYIIMGNVYWETNATGVRILQIRVNGGSAIGIASMVPGNFTAYHIVSTLYDLAVTDYVELGAYQNSGGNLNVLAALPYSPVFMMVKVA